MIWFLFIGTSFVALAAGVAYERLMGEFFRVADERQEMLEGDEQ